MSMQDFAAGAAMLIGFTISVILVLASAVLAIFIGAYAFIPGGIFMALAGLFCYRYLQIK